MTEQCFRTLDGRPVPAVTAREMAEVDRLAVEDVGLQLLQMMENAGRNLAGHVRSMAEGPVVVVAGSGGNGGGGLACARHLANRDVRVELLLDRPPTELAGATAAQFGILEAMDIGAVTDPDELDTPAANRTFVDALVGYGLSGELRGSARDHVEWLNAVGNPVVSLDVPSGLDATTGDVRGAAVEPEATITLALPKTGLALVSSDLYLADIAIPGTVYDRLDIDAGPIFTDSYRVELEAV